MPAGPTGSPEPGSSKRTRKLLIAGAASVVVAIVVGVVLFIQRSGQNTPTAGTGDQTTSSAAPPSTSETSSSASTASSPASPSPAADRRYPAGPVVVGETVIAQRTVDGQGRPLPGGRQHRRRQPTDSARGGDVPAISPDRRSILYLSTNEQKNTALQAIGTDGKGDRGCSHAPPGCERMLRPGWNPIDPNEIAAACYNAEKTKYTFNVVGLDGTVRRTLNVGQDAIDDPSWSPDGRRP